MALSIDQKIAQKEAELSRLRTKNRKLATGQKIVLGGMLINAAKHDPQIRAWLIHETGRALKREVDIKRVAPLLADLKKRG